MRKNSDYSSNNQLLLSKNVAFENLFRRKCDFCPFLGDFSEFCKMLRRGVEAKKAENGKVKAENYFFKFNFEPSAEIVPFSVRWRIASIIVCSLPTMWATTSFIVIGSVASRLKICSS